MPETKVPPRQLQVDTVFDWTPDVRFGGAAVGVTYGSRVAKGIKTGRLVHLFWSITLTNKGTSVGNCQIFGSPLAADSVPGLQTGFHVNTQVFYRIPAASQIIDLLTTANAAITNATLTNTSTLVGNLTFLTAA